ncbi:MAG: sulfoxide reductase heme-binding subunit YedZ [Chloroflexi bacterium]|nr:sulfoxide reductase heme-binding subunit YedZ [Chloroflexota bacterium]
MVLAQRLKRHWLQILTHVASLLPLTVLAWDYAWNRLSVDPIREITLRTGRYALTLLLLSLACTPLHVLFGFKQVMRVRRPLGLYAFLYAGLHMLTFVGLDYGFDLPLVAQAILERRFVQVGLLAFLILLPLAITSTRGWVRQLGRNWKRLHRLVYLAALLAVVHFVWVVKAGNPRPLPYGVALALLLVVRVPGVRAAVGNFRARLGRRNGG